MRNACASRTDYVRSLIVLSRARCFLTVTVLRISNPSFRRFLTALSFGHAGRIDLAYSQPINARYFRAIIVHVAYRSELRLVGVTVRT
jgi:hypothetical protein